MSAPLSVGVLLIAVSVPAMTQHPDNLPASALSLLVAWCYCIFVLARQNHNGLYGGPTVYVIVFGLFHGGLLFSVALRGSNGLIGDYGGWIYGARAATATHLSICGMLAFTAAATLVTRITSGRIQHDSQVNDQLALRSAMGITGLVIETLGALLFVLTIQHGGGLAVFSNGYGHLLDSIDTDGTLGYATLFLGIGAVMTIASGGRYRVAGWAIFGGYAIAAFPLGTRGAVLFPLLAMVVVEARQGNRPRHFVAIASAAGLLTLVSAVRQTRLNGVDALFETDWVGSPLDAIAEMGYTLGASVVVLSWEAHGEPFRGGVTFIAVPLRMIEKLLGIGSSSAFDDRLFNNVVMQRVGPIGGSPIAEGYYNGGLPGVVLLMCFIGLTIGWIARLGPGPVANATVGVTLIPLLTQVRNSFAPVPVHLAIGLSAVLIAVFISRLAQLGQSPINSVERR